MKIIDRDCVRRLITAAKKHWLAGIFALLVGIFAIAPQVLAIYSLGGDYKGLPFFYINDNVFYVARIQEILDGHGWVNSPYIFEYKNLPSLLLPFGEYFYAIPAFMFGLSAAESAVLLCGFILPAILFLLAYFLVVGLIRAVNFRDKISAVAASLFVILSLDLPVPRSFWEIASGKFKYATIFSWARPVNPITGAVLLFSFLLLLWILVNNNKKLYIYGSAAGVVLFLMVGYFFSWGVATAIWAALLLIFLLKKDWPRARAIIWPGTLAFVLLSLYFYRVFLVGVGQEGSATVSYGMSFTHQLVFNKILALALIIFLPALFYEYFNKKGEDIGLVWYFCLSLILGGIISLNQQIITGRTVWYYHFTQYTTAAAIVSVWTSLYLVFKNKYPRIILLADCVIVLLFLLYGTAVARTYEHGTEEMRSIQKYSETLVWLRTNGPEDCVVLAKEGQDEKLATMIPAFTQCNVYMTNLFGLSSVPPERGEHNFMIWLAINGVTTENVEQFLRDNVQRLGAQYTQNWKDTIQGMPDEKFEEKIRQIADDYRQFSDKDFLEEVNKYRVDYLLSETPLSESSLKQLGGVRPIKQGGPVYIYQW